MCAQAVPEAANAARAAAAVMAMNNVYYRFTHLAGNQEYRNMPAKLRMNVIGAPGIDKIDFELFSLAVSAINGCGMCIDAHEAVLKRPVPRPRSSRRRFVSRQSCRPWPPFTRRSRNNHPPRYGEGPCAGWWRGPRTFSVEAPPSGLRPPPPLQGRSVSL